MAKETIEQLQAEVERLRADNERLAADNQRLAADKERLTDEMMRLISRNLDLSEQLETDAVLHRRTEVAREILEGNVERQRNADLQDDGQLMALIELRLEKDRPHLKPDFDTKALAELLGVSMERLNRLFRQQTMHRTPHAYIDNLRLLNALRLLREQPNYSIASISDDSGFNHVRTMQRRIQEVIGMTPADYRALFTRDMKS